MRRVGLDIDGILYKWEPTARYMLRNVMPDSPYKDDPRLKTSSTHWGYLKDVVSKEAIKWLWSEGLRLGMFRHGHMYPGTIEAVRRLSARAEIVIITHRPKAAVPDTLAWLAYHQLPISEVHILSNQEPKSMVGDLDWFLDDKPENCYDMVNERPATNTWLWTRPWNEAAPFGWRVKTWEQFENAVRTL